MPNPAPLFELEEPIYTGPVWRGPCSDHPQGGISQSLIGDWISCRERFRVWVMEGLCVQDGFSAPLEFGNYFHAAEEAYAKRSHKDDVLSTDQSRSDWPRALEEYYVYLCNKYPFDRDKARHWYLMALAIFPKYVDHWDKAHDQSHRSPLLSESTFRVRYELPSGRAVYLRGKFDSVDCVTQGPELGVWLQENKTKSDINTSKILGQLQFDLQTMVYMIALRVHYDMMGWASKGPIRGVRYNVVKRPAHKSVENMLKAMNENQADGRIGEWFWRKNVEISDNDIARFKVQCLDPVLESICDDYEWWSSCIEHNINQYDDKTRQREFPHHRLRHFRMPYGVYSPLTEVWGGFGDVDNYLNTGSTAGLIRATELFPELVVKEDAVGAGTDNQSDVESKKHA